MEMETEQHMFYTEYAEDVYPPTVRFNDFNQSLLNPENQISLQNGENHVDKENEVQVNCDDPNQIIEQSETQQPLYKLNNIDTKALIKTDIKQLILTKISEEINSKALSDMKYEAQEQVSILRNRTNNLQNKNQNLDEQVKSDKNRLEELEVVLLKTNEMIGLLKENIEKLTVRHRELHINDILEKGLQQHENLQQLKKLVTTKLKMEKECLKEAEDSDIQRSVLKKELAQRQEVLKTLIKKNEDFKENVTSVEEEIGKNMAKKQKLDKNVAVIVDKKIAIEKESIEEKHLLSNLFSKNEIQTAKVAELNKEKLMIEQKLRDIVQELEKAKANLLSTDNHILEKQSTLATRNSSIKTVNDEFQESLKMLQSEYDDISTQLNELKTQLSSNNSDNNLYINELNKLRTTYMLKCDEKVGLIQKKLKHQNAVSDINLNTLKQQLQNDAERIKLQELKRRHQNSVTLLDSLENDIIKEQETTSDELMKTKHMFEAMQTEYNTYFLEMEKKKQYLLKNSKFLEEKAENLHREVTELEQCIKCLEEANTSTRSIVQQKSDLLEECKNKLSLARKAQENELPLKSGLKSPNKESITKKVKFNEILSFKSPSSSEVSNVQGENFTQLETSLREWLQESTETIEQEL